MAAEWRPAGSDGRGRRGDERGEGNDDGDGDGDGDDDYWKDGGDGGGDERGRHKFTRLLERVFDVYVGGVIDDDQEGTLSFDMFKVFLKDSGMYKKLLSSPNAVTTLLHDKLNMDFHEDFTKSQFIEANELLLKDNFIRSHSATSSSSSASSSSLSSSKDSSFNAGTTASHLWTSASSSAQYDAASSRLLALFSVYEMPSRLSTYQTSAVAVKLSSSPLVPSAIRRRTASDNNSNNNSNNTNNALSAKAALSLPPGDAAAMMALNGAIAKSVVSDHVVDLWEGTRVPRRPAAAERVADTLGGSNSSSNNNSSNNNNGGGGGSSGGGGAGTWAESRKRILTLIVDNSLVKPLEPKDAISGGRGRERLGSDGSYGPEGSDHADESNVGRSILDASRSLSGEDDEELSSPSMSPAGTQASSPVPFAASLASASPSTHKRGSNFTAGAIQGSPSLFDATHDAEDVLSAPEDESRGDKRTAQSLTSSSMSPTPPRTMNLSQSGGGASRKGKVFKKVYGLGRGVQHFTPRMTTSNRDRLKIAKKMAESTKLLASMNLHFTRDSGEGGTVDYSKELSPDASYAAHPSYKLYEEGMRLKKSRPDQAIIVWEKALALATSMPNNVSLHHRLHLYDSLVTLCLANKRLEHATDLMESHLEVIRQFTPDRTLEVRVMNKLGKTHFALGNYDESETCHALQQTLSYQIFDQRGEMQAFQGQGLALFGMRRFDEACVMFKRYLNLAEECTDKREVANAHGHLGLGYFEDDDLSEAFVSFKEQIIKLREVLNLTPGDREAASNMAGAFANLGKVYKKWGKAPLCTNALGKSLKLSRDLKNERMEAETSFELARVLVELRLGVDLNAIPKFVDRVPKGGVGSLDFSLNAVGKSLIIPIYSWKQTGWFAHLNVLLSFLTANAADSLASARLSGLRSLVNDAISHLSRALRLCRGKDGDKGLASSADDSAAADYGWAGGTGRRPRREVALDAATDMAGLFYLSGRREEGAACYDDARGILDEMEDLELMDSRSLRQRRVKLALFEGVYLVLLGSWQSAKKKFEYLISSLTAPQNENAELLAGSKMMYGWCLYYLGEIDASIVVFESSLECYDALHSLVESKALTLSSLAHVTFTKWQQEVSSRGGDGDLSTVAASDDGLTYTRELLGECFTIGSESDDVVLQILALERLAEIHDAVGETDIATDLMRRAFGLRGAAGDETGKNEMQAKMEIKKAIGGMDVGGTSDAPQWMD